MSNWKLVNVVSPDAKWGFTVKIMHTAPYCGGLSQYYSPYSDRPCIKCRLEVPKKMIRQAYKKMNEINKIMEISGA